MPIVGHGLDIRLVKCDRLPAFKLLKRIQVPRLPCHPIDCFFPGPAGSSQAYCWLGCFEKLFVVTTF